MVCLNGFLLVKMVILKGLNGFLKVFLLIVERFIESMIHLTCLRGWFTVCVGLFGFHLRAQSSFLSPPGPSNNSSSGRS